MAGRHRYRRMATLREILGRGPHARRPVAPVAGCGVGFAEGQTGLAHRVTTEALAAGRRVGGRYVALCGARVRRVRRIASARSHCPACEGGS